MSGEEHDTFHAPFCCSPEIGELPIGLRGIIIIRVPFPADSRDVACRVSPFNPLYATGICSVCQSLRAMRRGTPRLYKAAHCLLATTTPSFHPWSSVFICVIRVPFPAVSEPCGTPRLYKAAHCLLTAYH